ncbi:hypothetical protein CO612_03040 [Lysobacteraceae bacterium NML71-0210]|nr:hypothetical protein CO612_03040 [Xanthomonadaceae bacterium NML71-0210]
MGPDSNRHQSTLWVVPHLPEQGSTKPGLTRLYTMPNITIQLETNVQRLFDEGKRRGLDTAGLMEDIGEELLERTQRRFDAGVAPDGTAWAPPKSGGPSRLMGHCRAGG